MDFTTVVTQEDARRAAQVKKLVEQGIDPSTASNLLTQGGTTEKALIEMRDKFTADILKEYIAQSDEWKKIIGVTTIEELDKLPIAKDVCHPKRYVSACPQEHQRSRKCRNDTIRTGSVR